MRHLRIMDQQAFDRDDPQFRVDTAWRRAKALLARGGRISDRRDGPETVAALAYLRAVGKAGGPRRVEKVRENFPEIAAAHEVARGDGRLCWEVEARLLAGQDDGEVALACGLGSGVVGWFQSLFFQVRGRLHAHDWVLCQAVGRPPRFGEDAKADAGRLWRGSGYYGGPLAVDLLADVADGRPLTRWAEAFPGQDPTTVGAALRLKVLKMFDLGLNPPGTPRACLRLLADVRERKLDRPELTLDATSRRVARVLAEADLRLPRPEAVGQTA
ncbi:MAG: hypothetical protein U0835_16060 [Isosphaeraceae bacterium]